MGVFVNSCCGVVVNGGCEVGVVVVNGGCGVGVVVNGGCGVSVVVIGGCGVVVNVVCVTVKGNSGIGFKCYDSGV